MARGRPPEGPKLTERLDGSDDAKKRMRMILETVAGERSVTDACDALGISKTAFHELRNQVLQAGLSSLEPKPKGRPRKQPSPEQAHLSELQKENWELKRGLRASQIREQLAIVMPHVRQSLKAKGKKTKATDRRRKGRRSGDGNKST